MIKNLELLKVRVSEFTLYFSIYFASDGFLELAGSYNVNSLKGQTYKNGTYIR